MRIVSVGEMQGIERAADAAGHSYAAMMELAGRAVADAVVRRHITAMPQVLVLAGPGNNGGDGLVCARHIHEAGLTVRVYLWKRATDTLHDSGQHFARLQALHVPNAHTDDDPDLSTLHQWLKSSSVLVDALLGTGANRPITGRLGEILGAARARAHAAPLSVVAVDCPSGLNCDSGALDPLALPAAQTVTFAYGKLGHFKFPGAAAVGELLVANIGTDPALAADVQTFVLDAAQIRAWLPRRDADSHKGSFGKVMLAVGSHNFPGAAFLATAAAGRVGAGLVTGAVSTPVWPIVAGRLAEPTWLPLPSPDGAAFGAIDETAAPQVTAALAGYDALVLGCGLGTAPTTQAFVRRVLSADGLPPTIIDADGLNILAQTADWPRLLPVHAVLTPHPAEFARLCALPIDDVSARRWELAQAKAAEWNAVVLAKGPYTVIAAPDGRLAVLPVATPALATAGTGDVLAGAIGGLLAQGLDPFAAACTGAWLHGKAGERCAEEIGRAGVVASDLLPRLPTVISELAPAERNNFAVGRML
jgi:hydroxyethylthiazole kinase-like uncharacterized protein yjeF